MAYFRLVYRLSGMILIQIIMGLVGVTVVLLFLPVRKMRYALVLYFTRVWGRLCCWMMNIHIRQEGVGGPPPKGVLIVSNHIGTVDIMVVAACFEAFFISKSDVRSWPGFGLLARLGGTIFIDRTRKTQVSGMVNEAAERLQSGFSVVVFPEGGATPGHRVETFKPSAFEAAVRSGRPVLPVMIRYYEVGEPSVACWPIGQTFLENMMGLFMHPRMTVRVVTLSEVSGEADRRSFAQTSHRLISDRFEQAG